MTLRAQLATGFRRATRWRLLVLCAVLTAIPAALALLPIWSFLSALLAHAPRADLLATGMEGSWIPDLLRALSDRREGQAIPGGMAGALAVAFLLAPALSGAILAEAGSGHPLAFRPLLTGAGRFYGRMLRTSVVAVVPLGLAGAGIAAIARSTERAVAASLTESAAESRVRLALLGGALLFGVAHLTVDAARARIADRPDRRSALLAWLSGAWLVLRHPVRSAGIGLAGAAAGPLLGLVVMAVRERLPAGPTWAVVAGVLLAQAAAMAVGWGRAVRIVALAGLSRADRAAREERWFRRRRADRDVAPDAAAAPAGNEAPAGDALPASGAPPAGDAPPA
ncbi:MAG TPA: hypothetical protein VFM53_10460 [Anaeromyxobacteraceae bacterium]|nr:hypothetical protein [Anaeromyxobacteraceae bacterium]